MINNKTRKKNGEQKGFGVKEQLRRSKVKEGLNIKLEKCGAPYRN